MIPKLSNFQVCRPREIGFAFHRASIYKKDGGPQIYNAHLGDNY
jgi:hypothetical protein